MSLFFRLIGSGAGIGEVDATPNALRIIPYDSAGNNLGGTTGQQVSALSGGLSQSGRDYKTLRGLRADNTGQLRVSNDSIMLYDAVEGAAVNTNTWIQTNTTMTQAQASGVLTLNNSSLTTTNTGAMNLSHRMFPITGRTSYLFRSKQRHGAHFNNNVIEMGFGSPATAVTATAGNGAFWRKDTAGQYLPVVSLNGVETLGNPISNATFIASVPTTDYAIFDVWIEDTRAYFAIYTSLGVLVTQQYLDFPATGILTATHYQAFYRNWNNGAPSTAVQSFIACPTYVFAMDSMQNRDFRSAISGAGFNSLTSPTAYTQLAQHANSADPGAAVLSNTTPSYTTLGGLFIGPTPTPAGAVTDFALFGWTNPSPYTFFFTGCKGTAMNRGAAVATTATVLEWFLGFNASSGSLASVAPYDPKRIEIGRQVFAIGATVESLPTPAEVSYVPGTALPVYPGRALIVGLRIPVGTATAGGFLRGSWTVDGYFE